MPSDMMQKKLARMFALYDRNGDQLIEAEDYERIGQGFARVVGAKAGTPEYQGIVGFYTGSWDRLKVLDTDGDGKVGRDEFIAANAQLNHEAIVAISDTLIRMNDRDRDGKLSRDEFAAGLGVYDIPSAGAQQAFAKLDRDGDGYLVREELLKDVEEFFTSDDPNARGNWLVGPLD